MYNVANWAASSETTPNTPSYVEYARDSPVEPRSFDYHASLPYAVEDDKHWLEHLDLITKSLYLGYAAGDYEGLLMDATKQFERLLQMKFDVPKDTLIRLLKFYWNAALTPGIYGKPFVKLASTFVKLASKHRYVRQGDLTLNWNPYFEELKRQKFHCGLRTIPLDFSTGHKRMDHLGKMGDYGSPFFGIDNWSEILHLVLPYFVPTHPSSAITVISMLCHLLPGYDDIVQNKENLPSFWLPTIFHMWNLVPNIFEFDREMLRFLYKLSLDPSPAIPFGPYGIYTEEQFDVIMNAAFRLLRLPVAYATKDTSNELAQVSTKQNSDRFCKYIAAIIISSLNPTSTQDPSQHVLKRLSDLMLAISNYLHPSNSGYWSSRLSKLLEDLSEQFFTRWSIEQPGGVLYTKYIPRHLTVKSKTDFVQIMREPIFQAIYGKLATENARKALGILSQLEPNLILPRMLKLSYSSLSSYLESHRTEATLTSLTYVAEALISSRRFRPHVFNLMDFLLPALDPNDIPKTALAIRLLAVFALRVPLWNISGESGQQVAIEFIMREAEFGAERGHLLDDYDDVSEEKLDEVAQSCTASLPYFVVSFMERLFALFESFPESKSPNIFEDDITRTLWQSLPFIFGSLSPELQDTVIRRTNLELNHTMPFNARLAIAALISALAMAEPKRSLQVLMPTIIQNIRYEILENNAGIKRNNSTEVLAEHRQLVMNMKLLGHLIGRSGSFLDEALKNDITVVLSLAFDKLATFSAVKEAAFALRQLIASLLDIYPQDLRLAINENISLKHWAFQVDPKCLNINWYTPSPSDIGIGFNIYVQFVEKTLLRVSNLHQKISIEESITSSEWSDRMTGALCWLRSCIRSIAPLLSPPSKTDPQKITESIKLFESRAVSGQRTLSQLDEIRLCKIRIEIFERLHALYETMRIEVKLVTVQCLKELVETIRSFFLDVHYRITSHEYFAWQRLYQLILAPFYRPHLNKRYPRPILIQRAYLYHLYRRRYNLRACTFPSAWTTLLADLMDACTMQYVEPRSIAQTALGELSKCYEPVGWDLISYMVPKLQSREVHVLKGTLHTLNSKWLEKSPRYISFILDRFVASLINIQDVLERPSIIKLCTNLISILSREISTSLIGRTVVSLSLHDQDSIYTNTKDELTLLKANISNLHSTIMRNRKDLRLQLAHKVNEVNHWAARGSIVLLLTNTLESEQLAEDFVTKTVVEICADPHPDVQQLGLRCFENIILVSLRLAMIQGDRKRLVYQDYHQPYMRKILIKESFDIEQFIHQYRLFNSDTYFDNVNVGWLVWSDEIISTERKVEDDKEYYEKETLRHLEFVASQFTERHVRTIIQYAKQEGRSASCHFRKEVSDFFWSLFRLFEMAKMDDLVDYLLSVCQDSLCISEDKFEQRLLLEILSAIIQSFACCSRSFYTQYNGIVEGIINETTANHLNPDTLPLWRRVIANLSIAGDPARYMSSLKSIYGYRLDSNSQAVFKDSALMTLHATLYFGKGWPLTADPKELEDAIELIDNPYELIRNAVALQLLAKTLTIYHESYKTSQQLLRANFEANSSTGIDTYVSPDKFQMLILSIFNRLNYMADDRDKSVNWKVLQYTTSAKTLCSWFSGILRMSEGVLLLEYAPNHMISAILAMMEIRDDAELVASAESTMKCLAGNDLPYPRRLLRPMVDAIEKLANMSSWQQRKVLLTLVQVFFYRHLFLLNDQEKARLTGVTANLLRDSRTEVRSLAASTLTGILQCSGSEIHISRLIDQFKHEIIATPIRKVNFSVDCKDSVTREEYLNVLIRRHAPVLGLCAVIKAFPYTSPPPRWMPPCISFLSGLASDPGYVGETVRKDLSAFRKMRSDTWLYDQQYFTTEELENLEGSGPSYIA